MATGAGARPGPADAPPAGTPRPRVGFLCATAHGRPRRGRKRRVGYPPDPDRPLAREARPPRPAPARQGATARQASRPAEIPPRALLNRRRRERPGPRGKKGEPPWEEAGGGFFQPMTAGRCPVRHRQGSATKHGTRATSGVPAARTRTDSARGGSLPRACRAG